MHVADLMVGGRAQGYREEPSRAFSWASTDFPILRYPGQLTFREKKSTKVNRLYVPRRVLVSAFASVSLFHSKHVRVLRIDIPLWPSVWCEFALKLPAARRCIMASGYRRPNHKRTSHRSAFAIPVCVSHARDESQQPIPRSMFF